MDVLDKPTGWDADPNNMAMLMGAAVAIPILSWFIFRKVGSLTNQAAVMEAAITARASQEVELVAGQAAEGYLADTFGLTADRMAKLERLSAVWGSFG